jgi:hypothetical protein
MVHLIAALIYYWIDLNMLWLDQFDKVVVLAVVVIVHPPNLGLMKEGFGRLSKANLWLINEGFSRPSQPVNTSGGNLLKRISSQLLCLEQRIAPLLL